MMVVEGYLYFIGDRVNEKLGLEVPKGIYTLQSFRFACEQKTVYDRSLYDSIRSNVHVAPLGM